MEQTEIIQKKLSVQDCIHWMKTIQYNKPFLSLLLFTIASNGIYQYLHTTLPFFGTYLSLVYTTQHNFQYLSFSSVLASSFISLLLLYNVISTKFIKKYSLLLTAVLLFLLSFNNNFIILLIINALCCSLLSGFMVYIQTKMNISFTYYDLGKYTLIYNAVLSVSKIIFSLLSATLLNAVHTNLFWLYFTPSVILVIFQYICHYYDKKYKNINTKNMENIVSTKQKQNNIQQ